jgi:polysaccharide biosynthesis protein PslH
LAKILFLTSRFPYPLDKGDKLRVYYQLKSLAEDNEIHLIAIDEISVSDADYEAISPFCKSVHYFVLPVYKRIFQLLLSPVKGVPLQVAFFFNGKINRNISSIVKLVKPDFIHCHLIRTTEYVKNIQGIPKSLDFMDAFGKGMERRQEIEPNFLKRILYSYEKRQLYHYEKKVFEFIDNFSIISAQDKGFILSPRADEIRVVANGVDFSLFYPRNENKVYDILFMGNMSYPPNIAAVTFLVNEIMPVIKQSRATIKLLIAGTGAPKSIKRLQSENIDVKEKFNHISDSIAFSRIMLAPMLISIGLQNKILQAMAMKTPCIVSSLSNNAIKAPNHTAIIEANSPLEFANHIIDLLNDENKARTIGKNGYDFVKEHYSWEKQNELLKNMIIH